MKTLLYFLMLMGGLSAHAHVATITGTVSDASGPLPGANVVVKGTNLGDQTDFDGNYRIEAYPGQVLVFTYIGYVTQEVQVGNSLVINVTLQEDAQALEEVIVMGYGASNNYYPPSAAQIARQERQASHARIAGLLQGKAAGVAVVTSQEVEAIPKAQPDNEPLYIIDGMPVRKEFNAIANALDAAEIDKVTHYKGARARRLFGKPARHGCVVITTKQGNYQIENDEAYAQLLESNFERTRLSPLSTFAIDVDRASYSNVRRMINNGEAVPIDAVKVEEMINYFQYDYPQPTDEHPFSITTEMAVTPWNADTRLVRIGLQGKSYTDAELPPSNLTFLIDVSGSMGSSNKLPLLKSAFRLLVNQLREQDRVAIVVYAGAAGVVLPPTRGDRKEEILASLDRLEAGGSTAGGAGITLAYDLALKNFRKNGNNRVILATDGDFNVGASSDRAMEDLIVEKRDTGIFLSVLGFGMGNYKDSKLETLADKGNGNHAYIDNMQEAQKVFGKEFGGTLFTIAKDVKIQVEFNPAQVSAYRLIGYENRLLAAEDFADDTKDAGELGSNHSVTALYEVLPAGVDSPYLKPVPELTYTQQVPTAEAGENSWFTVRFRYKKPDGDTSRELVHTHREEATDLSPDFRFAAAVALFGMELRHSSYTNGAGLGRVVELAEAGKSTDPDGYRAEFIRLVRTQSGSL